MAQKLTPKQSVFVEEYLKDLNGTRAAIAAGYSEDTACQMASENLSKPYIQAAVQTAMAERSKRTQITADVVLKELLRVATADIGQAFNADGTLKKIHEMPEDIRRAISGVEVEELFEGFGADRTWIGYTRKVKFWDKPKTLELLGKHLGCFSEQDPAGGQPAPGTVTWRPASRDEYVAAMSAIVKAARGEKK